MKSLNGWIKLDRKICDWGWYHDGNTMRVFVHLLLMATSKDMEYNGANIRRGEVAVTWQKIADALKMTYDEVRMAVKHLKATGEVTVTRHSKYSLVRVVNYEQYQDVPSQNPNQVPIKSQSNPNHDEELNINRTRNKEIKNYYTRARAREENKNIIPVKRVAAHAFEERSDDSSLADIYAN